VRNVCGITSVLCMIWVVLCAGNGFAQTPGTPSSLRDRLVQDLRQGRDLHITSYVGLWAVHRNDPARNLYWGALYGHGAMFTESRRQEVARRLPFVSIHSYEILEERTQSEDPVLVRVISAPRPENQGGRVVVVYLVYEDLKQAMLDMGNHLKTGQVPSSLGDGSLADRCAKASYLIGYWGHNVYYGAWDCDDLEDSPVTTEDVPRGVFSVGCRTAVWFPQKLLGGEGLIEPVLFTRTNMAPEAYVALALYDGLGRGVCAGELVTHVARAYKAYQEIGRSPQPLRAYERTFVNDPARIREVAREIE